MPELTFKGLSTFAIFLDEGAIRLVASRAEAAKLAANAMLVTARAMYGESPPLRDLRESTQAERIGKGYSANQPLLRDGTLRDSVIAVATPTTARIESTTPIAAYHEFGYVTQPFGNAFANPVAVPPRPVFRYTILAVAPLVQELGGMVAKKVLGME